ncbi:MAG: hypothetical protein ACHP85_22035 [Burkholderiales bacterium]
MAILVGLIHLEAAASVASAQPSAPPATHADLSAQANNPNAPLFQAYLQFGVVPETKGLDGYASEVQLLAGGPVLLPRFLTIPQLLRLEVPLLTTPNPGRVTGLGDIDLVDVAMVVRKKSLSLGVGFALVLPAATSSRTGSGKWQLGPALGIMYTGVPNLIVGAVIQNPISIGGDSTREDVNELQITPTVTYTLPHGWFVGLGDFDWVFDWEGDSTLVPLVLQVGKVTKIGRHGLSLSAEAGPWIVHPDPPYPVWGVRVAAGVLFPGVTFGKGKKH